MSNSLATYVKHTGFLVVTPDAVLLMCAADCKVKGYGENEEVDEVVKVLAALLFVLLPILFRFVLL